MSVLWKSRTLIRSTAPEAMMNCSGTVPKESIPLYREDYSSLFSRETIMKKFAEGEREIYLEYRQKGDG